MNVLQATVSTQLNTTFAQNKRFYLNFNIKLSNISIKKLYFSKKKKFPIRKKFCVALSELVAIKSLVF